MKHIKPGSLVYFWWSSSSVVSARFVSWRRARNSTGGWDTNFIGTGAVMWNLATFSRVIIRKPKKPLTRGYYMTSPYVHLYTSNEAAYQRDEKRMIKVPHESTIQNKKHYKLPKRLRVHI